MKNLVKHYLHTNRKEIIERSLLHCHVQGLHSIILMEAPGKTIRIYITDQNHGLYKPGALALHPHHCQLTLNVVYGELRNIIYKIDMDSADGAVEYDKYLYKSHILDDEMAFMKVGSDFLKVKTNKLLRTGDSDFMKSSEIHTVVCSANTVNGWFVFEGKENTAHVPFA